jgi:hypothetical protein
MKDVHINGYYITQDYPTVKIPLEPQKFIRLNSMGLIELVLPKCEEVFCYGNNLKELIIPEGCKHVSCGFNNLTKLTLANSCTQVWCNNNELTELFIPNDCVYIDCTNNKLTELIVPKNCYIWC